MREFLLGGTATFYFVIGLFFLRFWKTTKDRFFLFFAMSFLIECANRASLYLFFNMQEDTSTYYLIRLFVYSLIVVAIIDKNRPNKALQ
ncbi:MAG: hypothetical protein EOO68_01235 [Moraxellaceae bacterium]|jgi:hypothetical protein|nr:MAG: hypothetical protein EOO68_01235 [Moraxellaceae bacterium]